MSAVNAAGATQAFTFTGNFGAAPQVGVSFVNDDSDGTPQHDCNLYLDGFSSTACRSLGSRRRCSMTRPSPNTLSSVAAPAQRASYFVNSVGVDVHPSCSNTLESNVQTVAASMAYLGLNHMSAGVPNAQTLAPMQTLAALGVKFAVIMPSVSPDSLLLQQLAAVDALAPAIAAIQGPNEVNIFPDFSWDGQAGADAAHACEAALFADVEADPNLKGAPVYGLTIAGAGAYTAFGSIAATECGRARTRRPWPPFGGVLDRRVPGPRAVVPCHGGMRIDYRTAAYAMCAHRSSTCCAAWSAVQLIGSVQDGCKMPLRLASAWRTA